MRYLLHPKKDEITLTGIMYALSDSIRLQIVTKLADGADKGAWEFKAICKLPTLAYHFRILREAGITLTRIEGRNHYISLRREDLDERFPGLLNSVLNAARETKDASSH